MNSTLSYLLICVVLFLVMLLASLGGHRLRGTASARAREHASAGVVTGAVFALLGLLVAFTFSGAHSRLDMRRYLIVDEVNAIGTAWHRLDLLPAEARGAVQDLFHRYTASRAELYHLLVDRKAALKELERNTNLQEEIWDAVVAATEAREDQGARRLLLPALNEMFDLANTRTIAIQTHPPPLLYAFLTLVALLCAVLVGYSGAPEHRLNPVYAIGFAASIALTFYVILDLDHPRVGLVRLDSVNHELVRLASTMD